MGEQGTLASEMDQRVAQEVRAALDVDETRLGDVWRLTRQGLSPNDIAAQLGTDTPNFVNKYLRFARALETGDLPTAPSMVRECARTFRRVLKRHPNAFTDEVRDILEQRCENLRELAENPEMREREDEELDGRARVAERAGVTGIYVYTLPHYHNHPMQPSDLDTRHDRTLMKVGKSDSDVIRRFQEQARNTSLPEDPRLLRIYTGVEGKGDVEGRFHRLLAAADHRRNRGKAAGSEWFLTSLTFLDALAQDIGLTTHFALDEDAEQG